MKQIDLKNNPNLVKIFICVFVSVLAVLGSVYTYAKCTAIKDSINTKTQELEVNQERLASLTKIAENYDTINKDFEMYNTILPTFIDHKDIISNLDKLSSQYEVKISSINIDDLNGEAIIDNKLYITLALSGEYSNVLKFCDAVTYADNITKINNLHIYKSSDTESAVTADLAFSSYINQI